MKKLLVCEKVCPVVAELKHEIACLKQENNSLRKKETKLNARINILIAGKRDNEVRIQKAKEALFSLPDSNITGGP
tara:strand:- start:293 stop:520 length:228 start_codon:yes stop_codon:yes gene_type:complete